MLTVHHLNNSRSQRVLWLLEELGLPYEIAHYQRDKKTMLAPPELRAIHPLGKSPVITDEGRTIAESGAIIEYLLDKVPGTPWRPQPNTEAYLRYRYFLHYGEASLMPLMVMALIFGTVERAPMPFFIKPIAKGIVERVRGAYLRPETKSHLTFLDGELSQRPWLAGDLPTGADAQLSFPVEAAMVRSGGKSYPNIAAWLERVRARPAYQRALQKGGPLTLVG